MAWHSGKPADNDFLSASVQHIRENFAELEPLQPHVAELVDLTVLHPHVAALLDSRIVEVGSNANGEYVRWENGLQICVHTGPTFSVDASSYEFYQWSQFPASFDEVWVVLGSSTTTGGAIASRLTRGTLGVLEGTYRVWMVNDSTDVRQ